MKSTIQKQAGRILTIQAAFIRGPISRQHHSTTSRIYPTGPVITQKYYPAPITNVTALPLMFFPITSSSEPLAIDSDVTGIRIDHQFRNNDTLFGRYNRSNANNINTGGASLDI